jgi:hypothetical protein
MIIHNISWVDHIFSQAQGNRWHQLTVISFLTNNAKLRAHKLLNEPLRFKPRLIMCYMGILAN